MRHRYDGALLGPAAVASARIPTSFGDFGLFLYPDRNHNEHMAMVLGEVRGARDVLIRIHSECFTGDTLGSLRCDCGSQLQAAIRRISAVGRGVVVYLRQEGRGIGLRDKLRAYNLQDEGYDTVDANLALGHGVDERDYDLAARILEDLGVSSVVVLTNNPKKTEALIRNGISVSSREPASAVRTALNDSYLSTKAMRMGHSSQEGSLTLLAGLSPSRVHELTADARAFADRVGRPFVTLTYAQSLDGSIAKSGGSTLRLSGPESLSLTHSLRASHDAILVGIDTVIADDPQLNVRYAEGPDPQVVVLDSTLRLPVTASLLANGRRPWIATTRHAHPERIAAVEALGASTIQVSDDPNFWVDLPSLLAELAKRHIASVIVEGGAKVIHSFLTQRLVDEVVITVSPTLVGGLPAIANEIGALPRLRNLRHEQVGDDIVIWGEPSWPED